MTFQHEFRCSSTEVCSHLERLQLGKICFDSSVHNSTIDFNLVVRGGRRVPDQDGLERRVVLNGERSAFHSTETFVFDGNRLQVRVVREFDLRNKGKGAQPDFNLSEFQVLIDLKARELFVVHRILPYFHHFQSPAEIAGIIHIVVESDVAFQHKLIKIGIVRFYIIDPLETIAGSFDCLVVHIYLSRNRSRITLKNQMPQLFSRIGIDLQDIDCWKI